LPVYREVAKLALELVVDSPVGRQEPRLADSQEARSESAARRELSRRRNRGSGKKRYQMLSNAEDPGRKFTPILDLA
jgi:hypothetical protein